MPSPQLPELKFLHAAASLNRVKLEVFRKSSTEDLQASLLPGQPGALKARADGIVLDGHHRLAILLEREVNIQVLSREIIDKEQ